MKLIKYFDKFYPYLLFSYLALVILLPKLPLVYFYTTPVRLEDIVLVPIVLLLLIKLFFSRQANLLRNTPFLKRIGLWIALLFLATGVGLIQGTTNLIGFVFVLRFIEYLSLFFIAFWGFSKLVQAESFVRLLIFVSVPVSLYSIAQKFGLIGGFGGGFYQYSYVAGTDRSFSTFSGPYELGAFYIILLPLLAGRLYLEKGRMRILLFVIFLLSLISLAFTGARAPVFAAALAIGSMWLWSKRWSMLILAALTLVAPFFISSTLAQRAGDILVPASELASSKLKSFFPSQPEVATKPPATEAVTKPPETIVRSGEEVKAGPNLLKNGSFEQGVDNWSVFGNVRLTNQPEEVYEGKQALVIESGDSRSGISQSIGGLNPGKIYRAEAYFYVDRDAVFSGASNEFFDWYGVVYWHGYRQGSPLLYNRDFHLEIFGTSPRGSWFKYQMQIAGVDELQAVPPVHGLSDGRILVDYVSLSEVGDQGGPLELTSGQNQAVELSLRWRLEQTWPRVVKMLQINPLLGGGMASVGIGLDSEYATLLGESGFLGLAAFVWLMIGVLLLLNRSFRQATEESGRWLFLAALGMTLGMLAEATLVDVFRASKIAMVYWFLVGMVLEAADITWRQMKQ